jgi:F-type H+-transporting ATPase subunit epsilon
MQMKELTLSVVTPERSILKETAVESIILPGSAGQFNVLPGHTNFLSTLRYGIFAYLVKGEWQIAFLSGGFTQIFDGKVTVLAETVEMAQELDLAKAEHELQTVQGKLKAAKVGTPEYSSLALDLELAKGKVRAAQKKRH